MLAVVKQKKVEGLLHGGGVGRVAESAADEHGRAVSDVGVDDLEGQFVAAEVAQHGVDRGGQVFFGVDQCAIEIEQKQLNFFQRDGPKMRIIARPV